MNISISKKLTIFLMTTSTVAVFCSCLMFYFIQTSKFKETYLKDLNTLADIIGRNCQASLVFHVPEDADRALNSLAHRSSVFAAVVYDENWNVFSSYENKAHDFSIKPGGPEEVLDVDRQIVLDDGIVIGHIVIHDDMKDIKDSRRSGLAILLVVGFLALAVSWLVAFYLQKFISRPLLNLTKAVKDMAAGNFETVQNVKIKSRDELGMLTESFVEMGLRLKKSYQELEDYNHKLGEMVADRTKKLEDAISSLHNSKDQLIHSEKMAAIGQLVAGIAHEVNNSINFISAAVPTIDRLVKKLDLATAESAEQKQIFMEIETVLVNAQEGVRRTKKIVADLHSFARPGQGVFKPTDINRELDRVINLLQYELRNRVTVHKEYEDLPEIMCIGDLVNQVFLNVLMNSSQAIKGQGDIWIKTGTDMDRVFVSVRDNGGGIDPKNIKKIFDPFFTTKEVGQGTGLGLSISHGTIQAHNGEIKVINTSREGTEIAIFLPIEQSWEDAQ